MLKVAVKRQGERIAYRFASGSSDKGNCPGNLQYIRKRFPGAILFAAISVVAWRIFYITLLARVVPEMMLQDNLNY